MAVDSPCTQICKLDVTGGHCVGCLRSLDEIARWSSASDAWKRQVLAALPGRALRKA